jgi:hypothetical protein
MRGILFERTCSSTVVRPGEEAAMDEHQLRIDEIGAKATESDLIGGWQ